MSRRLALLAAVPLTMLAVGGTAAAAPAPSSQPAAQAPSTAQGITLCHEGFEIQLAPVREGAVVVLIGANDYGLIAGHAC
jgi:hypothetical protein